MIKHIAVVFPASSTGPTDVATGYVDAFRRLGIRTTGIYFNSYVKRNYEMMSFRTLFEPEEEREPLAKAQILERASSEAAFMAMREFPDLIVVIDGTQLHRLAWDTWRRVNIPTALVMTECPYRDTINAYTAEVADYAFANDRASARKMALPYLPVAYCHEIHHPMFVPHKYRSDVCFIGSGWSERVEILEGTNWDGIDLVLIGHYPIDHSHPLARFYKGAVVPNPEAAMYYNGAKIALNLNRRSIDYDGEDVIEEGESLSARPYEIAACGTFMLSQGGRTGLTEVFGELVPTFSSGEELEVLVREWLPKDTERAQIGQELRNLMVFGKQSYVDRAVRLLETVAL